MKITKKMFKEYNRQLKKAEQVIVQRKDGMAILCDGFRALKVPDDIYEGYFADLLPLKCEENQQIIDRDGGCAVCAEMIDFDRIMVKPIDTYPVKVTFYVSDPPYDDCLRKLRLCIGYDGRKNNTIAFNDDFIKAFAMFDAWESEGKTISPIYAKNELGWEAVILPVRYAAGVYPVRSLMDLCGIDEKWFVREKAA